MKFSVGDKVRVYSVATQRVGEVFQVIGSGLLYIYTTEKEYAYVHEKQCRKLVKKERRRVWVYINPVLQTEADTPFSLTDPDSRNPNWIEFVETRKKKK